MAVYTEVSDDQLRGFLAAYDLGAILSFKGIAEGVENSNYMLQTERGTYILTLYEKRVDPKDLPFFLGLMNHLAARGISCPLPVADRKGSTLGTLAGFRWIEHKLPSQFYAHFVVRFARGSQIDEDALRALIRDHQFTIANLNYRLDAVDDYFEYRMVVRTNRSANARRLSETLSRMEAVREFRLSPTGD